MKKTGTIEPGLETSIINRSRIKPGDILKPRKSIKYSRLIIQIAFSLLCLWIGIEFHYFVKYLESGGTALFVERSPGVEGFLPISALMSLYYFLITGDIHFIHPAGIFILIAIILISFIFGKSFCSWFCPVGFLSEKLGDLGERLFGKKIKIPAMLDYPLRSLKYLLLGFFVYSIFFLMTTASLKVFLDSPYNIVADIKMYYFFADISQFSFFVISTLFLLSIVFRNFWCRYLCPYGALLGILSLISPLKIKRNENSCIDCNSCTEVCPSKIKVAKVKTVISDECTSCLNCVANCPVKNTLEVKTIFWGKKISSRFIIAGIVILFMGITGLAMITGNWSNGVTTGEYIHYHKFIKSYGHPTGTKEIEHLNKETQTNPTNQP
ncbi:MAG: 4Fe-4S binding protein [candidate division Zixibacteria bacterium]|nr:4Fe-4S binding protein [candidate division Zixibacteria bacterium]